MDRAPCVARASRPRDLEELWAGLTEEAVRAARHGTRRKRTPQAWRREAQEVIAPGQGGVEASPPVERRSTRGAGRSAACPRSISCSARSRAIGRRSRGIPRAAPDRAVREALDAERRGARAPAAAPPADLERARRARGRAGSTRAGPSRSRPVINATGVVLHTNLGRALLSPAGAGAACVAVGAAYSNLEMDVARKERGSRYSASWRRCCAGSPAPRTRWSSTTAPPRCCWRSRRSRAARKSSSRAAS